MIYKTHNSIEYIECINNKNAKHTTIVLFHGYGANAQNLVPLQSAIKTHKKYNWIFPEGIFDVSLENATHAKSWFPSDMNAFHRMQLNKEYDKLACAQPLQFEKSLSKINEFLKHFENKNNHLILGGFSQGGIIASNLAFYRTNRTKALILFSSILINKTQLEDRASNCKNMAFIQSHGTQDTILNYEMAQKLYNFLKKQGLKGDFISFKGEHTIPLKVLEKTAKFLDNLQD